MKKLILVLSSLSFFNMAFADVVFLTRNNAQDIVVTYQFCHYQTGSGFICNPNPPLGIKSKGAVKLNTPEIMPGVLQHVKVLSAEVLDESGRVVAQGNFSDCTQSYSEKYNAAFILENVSSSIPVLTCTSSSY